jgi:DNA-directed RNA polymerase sigma subunit (sigma70/sigma32)
MGLYNRAAGRKRRKEAEQDLYDGRDPQIKQWLFVQLCVDPPDPGYDETAEAPEPDRDLLNALGAYMRNVLSAQERYVIIQRIVAGDTYATVAETAWPRLRDARHARQIERRALAKLKSRLLKYYKG